KPAECRRFGDEQAVATERAQRLQPRGEEVAAPVALLAIVVRPRVGDVIRVMTQLADDERRRVHHVVDVLELVGPVRAGVGRARTGGGLHACHGVTSAHVRRETGVRVRLMPDTPRTTVVRDWVGHSLLSPGKSPRPMPASASTRCANIAVRKRIERSALFASLALSSNASRRWRLAFRLT